MKSASSRNVSHAPLNKGKLVGQKPPLRLKHIWANRVRLQLAKRTRELAMFSLAIDSKLRARHLVKMRVSDICHGESVSPRAIVLHFGLDFRAYRTNMRRRNKLSLIYPRTKNQRAVQLLLEHAKVESTVRYLGFEVDDALETAE